MIAEKIALIEKEFRPSLTRFLGQYSIYYFSFARKIFLEILQNDTLPEYHHPKILERSLWGIKFRSPLMNAAGMFKSGKGYYFACSFGLGGFIAGTTTSQKRKGNRKKGISQPLIVYPFSGCASNWLGLPNPGTKVVAETISKYKKKLIPIGASVALDPESNYKESLVGLISDLKMYEKSSADFIEINYSCPNSCSIHPQNDLGLKSFLKDIRDNFLAFRKRVLPVIVKFSNDSTPEQAKTLVDKLLYYGFDGVTFGNTSINYADISKKINILDKKNFEYFTAVFGGGVSGRVLKEKSLELCSAAVEHAQKYACHEFHVFRSGGVKTAKDLEDSDIAGVSMNMAYTGIMEGFSEKGVTYLKSVYDEYIKKIYK